MLIDETITRHHDKKGTPKRSQTFRDLYLVKFIKDDISPDNKTDECQNCGAPIKNGEHICPYCDRKTGNIKRYEEWTILDRQLIQ